MSTRDASVYHDAIVATARAAVGQGRLTRADGSATVDNPLCGDRVTIDVALDRETVTALAHVVRGCLLCEAAAGVIGMRAVGERAATLLSLHQTLAKRLAGAASSPRWEELEMFLPVSPIASRHRCVLLPFEALHAALEDAGVG